MKAQSLTGTAHVMSAFLQKNTLSDTIFQFAAFQCLKSILTRQQ